MKHKLSFVGLLMLLSVSGCLKKGDKGDPGAPATSIGGTSYVFTGNITPAVTIVPIDGLQIDEGDYVMVYVCKVNSGSGIPCDQIISDTSLNVYYLGKPSAVEIYNAAAQGYVTYSVSAVLR